MHVTGILPAGSWEPAGETDEVLIDHDRRFRRRIVLTTASGVELLIDLPQAVRLKDGDGLAVGTGIVRVRAQPESLMEIHAARNSERVRIAWHLGNRHLPVQLLGQRIRIRADHVIGAMVEGLGGQVTLIKAPFDPEAGAYAGDGRHHYHDDNDHSRR